MQKKTFNLYCDESSHLENDGMPYMLIGYISSAYPHVKIHSQNIREIKADNEFKGEIKWSKLSESNYKLYSDLIDYFFASNLNFRAVIIEKSRIDNNKMGFSFNDFYYRMYYQLIHHKINMDFTYNIYLDIKDTFSYKKNSKLREILNFRYGNIRNLQFIRSHESVLMQLADVIMGAINYYLRGGNKVHSKLKIIEKIKNYSKYPLDCTTPRSNDKFNLFFIELK